MQYQKLGDTQIKVSRLGLGCGGPNRLGLARGASDKDAVRLIELAVSMGINLIDTAAVYRNEAIVGRAIKNVKTSYSAAKFYCPRHYHCSQRGHF